MTWKDVESKTWGEPNSQAPYNDLAGVSALTSLPDFAFHRNVDKIILAAGSDAVKTAIICPPTIYGTGRGPGNQRSIQLPNLVARALWDGEAPIVGRGLSEWDNVHIYDLSDLYVLLVDAIAANNKDLDKELWGAKGYYLAENGHHVWGDVTRQVVNIAYHQRYINSKELKSIDPSTLRGVDTTWGLNSRGYAKRARIYLGWKPSRVLEDEIANVVASEAALLGMKPLSPA